MATAASAANNFTIVPHEDLTSGLAPDDSPNQNKALKCVTGSFPRI
jgi:hypothetical protein